MHEVEETRRYPKHSVTVMLGGTFPDNNFGNTRHEISFTLEGKPEDSPSDTYDKAMKFVEKKYTQVAEQLMDNNG